MRCSIVLVVIAVTLLACTNTPQNAQVQKARQPQLEAEEKARAEKQIEAERQAFTLIANDATLSIAEWNALIGKTPAQVIERMGKPDSTSSFFGQESWRYNSASVKDPLEDSTRGIIIFFNTRREQPDCVVRQINPQRKAK
jgi:hypothetical protein